MLLQGIEALCLPGIAVEEYETKRMRSLGCRVRGQSVELETVPNPVRDLSREWPLSVCLCVCARVVARAVLFVKFVTV